MYYKANTDFLTKLQNSGGNEEPRKASQLIKPVRQNLLLLFNLITYHIQRVSINKGLANLKVEIRTCIEKASISIPHQPFQAVQWSWIAILVSHKQAFLN